ncbi:hypothetical protein [Rubritalea tangerina]|uniref:hypothetical protein n=1 Tax=Rubritalea tangerina TaxID=430798 RepID=UPI00361D02E8
MRVHNQLPCGHTPRCGRSAFYNKCELQISISPLISALYERAEHAATIDRSRTHCSSHRKTRKITRIGHRSIWR